MFSWFKRKAKSELRLSIVIPEDLRDQFVVLASKLQLTGESLATRVVLERVKELAAKFDREKGSVKAADEAFAALDEADEWQFGADIVLPLSNIPDKSLVVLPSSHPCRYFDPTIPKMFRGNEVVGSCQAQGGKPCLYRANVATNCSLYYPKKAPKRT